MTPEQRLPERDAAVSREASMVVLARDATGHATIWADPDIAPFVKALNDAGLPTIASCCGHGQRPGSIALADGRWVMVFANRADYDRAEAVFPVDINGQRKVDHLAEAYAAYVDHVLGPLVAKHEATASLGDPAVVSPSRNQQ